MALKYTGNGRFLVGIPAMDLSDEDVRSLELSERELIESGLYEKIRKQKQEVDDGD
jgi:hypothetical protein